MARNKRAACRRPGRLVAGRDPLLIVAGGISATLFGLLSMAMVATVASGIKDSEVVVVTIFTTGCVAAFVSSCLLLFHSDRWAVVACSSAFVAAVGCYLFEADVRAEGMQGYALILVAVPFFIGLLVLGGFLRSARARAARRVPAAKITS